MYSEIEYGIDGTNFYSNLGRDKWAILLDDFMYGDRDMTNGERSKIALIDSGNVSIQLPHWIWDNLLIKMQYQAMNSDFKIDKIQNEKGQWEIRVMNKNCDEVWPTLQPIEFKIESSVITIQPKGYTYQLDQF